MAQWQSETKDSNPSQLTEDWYDRENGKRLNGKQVRGQMPGGKIAMKTNASGPF
jgi:hypothetical protein